MTDVKICGVKTPEAIAAAARCGARYIGLVFAVNSPRYVEPDQAALLARNVPTGMRVVGLFVNPDDTLLSRVWGRVPLDMIQLHGAETPERVMAIKSRFGVPVMKALPIATAVDLDQVKLYAPVCDWLLFDAKAPASAHIEGGNGISFDWTILKGLTFDKPWMLAGGLTPDNITEALNLLKPDAVDVSSGVESSPGIKDSHKIEAFIQAAKRSSYQ